MNPTVQIVEAKSILSKSTLPTSDFVANPYTGCAHGCKYCSASYMKKLSKHMEPWGEFVDVKNWPKIDKPEQYKKAEIIIGSVTDPYQPVEEMCQRTRKLLKQLRDSKARITIMTKSDLILRDLELIQSIPHIRVGWSINTLNENFRTEMDGAVSIERRLAAMKAFHDAGVQTICYISPIFPGITFVNEIIHQVKDHCDYIWLENLNLKGDQQPIIMDYIRTKHPELAPMYEDIFSKGDLWYWAELDERTRAYASTLGFQYVCSDRLPKRHVGDPPIIISHFFHEPGATNKSQMRKATPDKKKW